MKPSLIPSKFHCFFQAKLSTLEIIFQGNIQLLTIHFLRGTCNILIIARTKCCIISSENCWSINNKTYFR